MWGETLGVPKDMYVYMYIHVQKRVMVKLHVYSIPVIEGVHSLNNIQCIYVHLMVHTTPAML